MKEAPLVSIALCTYNGSEFLSLQLDGLVNQSYKNIEIVVVDDCSTDDTFAILEDYARQYPQFKIHRNQQNLGFAGNFEKAVKLCEGELIALCDQDDLWDVKKIALQVDAIKDNVLIYHDSEFIHHDGTSINKKMSDLMNLYRGDDPIAILFFNCVSGHTILMKKTLIDAALPLRKGYFHDWWLAYVATNIGTIDFIPQCLVKYRQHDQSETNILKMARDKDNYKMSSIQNYEHTLSWLKICRSFKANKNQALINQIYNAYKKRAESYYSIDLGMLLFKHWKTIFFIRKKPVVSKLNYIRKQFLGIKVKKLIDRDWS
ncbi:glycosyltransferase family 2 protein [uncultured Mucilaginibacter sp.]|uniref:glycosyltransferase family 2 protein n=1 Tax=uncultured Mucilaginibacter sp. TaxID=797541 RepID=UPI0025F344DC|nr:glycosyltransferase family 2 protein [uncultured Mucilaginibacter sp.]